MLPKGRGLYPDAIDRYRRNGWVKIKGVFCGDSTAIFAEFAAEYAHRQSLDARNRLVTDVSADGRIASRKLVEPVFQDARFAISPWSRDWCD